MVHRLTQDLGKMQVQLRESELASKPACVLGGGKMEALVGLLVCGGKKLNFFITLIKLDPY